MSNKFDKLIKHEAHQLIIGDTQIIVHDGVFTPDPQITNSTSIILNNLPNVEGKDVLDMGTGTGIIAITCANKGANKVVAVDTSDKALKNSEENIQTTQVEGITLVHSDLYENVSDSFDYIFANLPIDDELWNASQKTTSTIERFLLESTNYLKRGGRVYLPWFSISDVKEIRSMADKIGYKEERMLTEEKLGYLWYLLILSFE